MLVQLIWFCGIAGQLALSFAIYKTGFHKKFICFAFYVNFSSLAWITALVVSRVSLSWYTWVLYTHEVATDVITALVIYELYRKVFGPDIAMPKWIPQGVMLRLTAALMVTAVLSTTLNVTNGFGRVPTLWTLEQWAETFLYLSLWSLAIYSRILGMTWSRRVTRIATGFVLFMTINFASLSFRGQFGASASVLARMAGAIAYILALILWTWEVTRNEPAKVRATPEEIAQMFSRHQETMEMASRMIVG